MDIGFIGLGHMGFPMARRLIDAGHDVVAFDTRGETLDRLMVHGARPASSPKEVANSAETVLASLPSPNAAVDVAGGLADGGRVRRYVDLSTIGSATAVQIHGVLADFTSAIKPIQRAAGVTVGGSRVRE
jgi:3-hydroxyisobutyrate dehydrogenase-like beta-hydroxyacid dehydrogenase